MISERIRPRETVPLITNDSPRNRDRIANRGRTGVIRPSNPTGLRHQCCVDAEKVITISGDLDIILPDNTDDF